MLPYLLLLGIFIVALAVRSLPARWGYYLDAFDPWIQYKGAKHVVDHGFGSWFNWTDQTRWYPEGVKVAEWYLLGVPFTGAALYKLTSLLLQIDLLAFLVVLPVVLGGLACLAVFLYARDVGDEWTGLIASFFMAFYLPFVQRTRWGFFDNEALSILLIVLFSFLFLRSIRQERILHSVAYSALASLSLVWLVATWGGARFILSFFPLFVFVSFILDKYSPKLLLSYGIAFFSVFGAMAALPKPTLSLGELHSILLISGLLLLLLAEGDRRGILRLSRIRILVLSAVLAAGIFVASFSLGEYPVYGKFLAALSTAQKEGMPLVASVAENKTFGADDFLPNIGGLMLPLLIGFPHLILKVYRREETSEDTYLLLFGTFSMYFALSMVRLFVLAAMAICTISAIGIRVMARPIVGYLEERRRLRRKRRSRVPFPYVLGFAVILVLSVVVQPISPLVVSSAVDRPSAIVSSGLPFRESVDDWLETLEWIKTNTPSDAIIASWWDYGYWINVLANRTTLTDNGTLNTTKIERIAEAFLSPEEEASEIFRDFDVDYVVVFISYAVWNGRAQLLGYGEENKWIWMAKISGLDETRFVDPSTGQLTSEFLLNTTLGKMMLYGVSERLGVEHEVILQNFTLVHLSPSNGYVMIYEVKGRSQY